MLIKNQHLEPQQPYLRHGGLNDADKDLLRDLRILDNVEFLNSLDQSFQYSTAFLSRAIIKDGRISTIGNIDLTTYDREFLIDILRQQNTAESHRKIQLLQVTQFEQFDNILTQLLGIDTDSFYNKQIKQLLRLINLNQDDPSCQDQILSFVLGDRTSRVCTMLNNFLKIYESEHKYKLFKQIADEMKIHPREVNNLRLERAWQASFIMHLINFPMDRVVEIGLKYIRQHMQMLFFLEQFGLLVTAVNGDNIYIKVSQILSLQQMDKYQQSVYYKIFTVDNTEGYKKQVHMPIFVESTGRISYYIQGQREDQINLRLLNLFCDVEFSLDHCTIFTLSRSKVSQNKIKASLMAQFLQAHCGNEIPADLVNLLDSWQNTSTYVMHENVAVFQFSYIDSSSVEDNLLYFLVLEQAQGCVLYQDTQLYGDIKGPCGVVHNILFHQDSKRRFELRRCIQQIKAAFERRAKAPIFVVVRQEAYSRISEVIQTQAERLRQDDFQTRLDSLLKRTAA